MNEVTEASQNCRKNCRNSKVKFIDGPKKLGAERGAWLIARYGNTDIPIYKTKNRLNCKGEQTYQYEVRFITPEGVADLDKFSDLAAAKNRAAQLAVLPVPAALKFKLIPRDQLGVIAKAVELLDPILKPLNISLQSGIEEYAGAKQEAGNKDLREVVKEYLAADWVKKSKTPLGDVIAAFLKARKDGNHRPNYLDTLKYNLERFAKPLGHLPIGQIKKDDLLKVIRLGGIPRSQKTYWTSIRTFFKWCKIQDYLHPAKSSEAEKLEKIIVVNPPPAIYTVPEAKKILGQTQDIPVLLYLSLSFFTGVRQVELGRLNFSAVNTDGVIIIEAEDAKGYSRRIIPMQPVLQAWLSPFYGRTGLIVPFTRMRAKISQLITALDLPYRRNGFRHSYASYRLAQTDRVTDTAQEDGHSAYILERDYLHRVTRDQAAAYFELTPEACGISDWAARVAEYLLEHPPLLCRRKNKPKPEENSDTAPPAAGAPAHPESIDSNRLAA